MSSFAVEVYKINESHHWDFLYFVDTLKAGEISVRIYRNTRFVDILKRYFNNESWIAIGIERSEQK